MEAPNKIHVQPNAHDRWFEGKIPSGLPNGLFVEYTRTDAFIEKACEFLANDANIPLWEGYNDTFGCDTSRLVNNFKKYMKGD